MMTVDLTADQLACIDSLSEDCTIVGVRGGCPLVRHAGGQVAILESNGRLNPDGHRERAFMAYTEVRAS
jgi:hypothetical protein